MNNDKTFGAFIGLAVGDALGTTLEFKQRDTYEHITDMIGGGPFRLNPGEWTDDTSMALALAQALVDHGMDKNAILSNFAGWMNQGDFSHNNRCFDIGATTRNAIQKYINDGTLIADPHFLNSGNGGIMRLAPAVMFAKNINEAYIFSQKQSETTHSSEKCMDYAGSMGSLLWELINDVNDCKSGMRTLTNQMFPNGRNDVSSTGYVEDTYRAAIWAWSQTDTFKDALLLAVNLGDDADTVGAVTGQIAGAYYGLSNIPNEWVEKLAWKDKILSLCEQLTNAK